MASKTKVNDKASSPESMDSLESGIIPGNGKEHNMGGPTSRNEQPDNDSAKLNIYKPGQSKTAVNSKAVAGDGSMDTIGGNVIPGNANYDGSKPGRPDTSGGPDSLDDSIAYGATKGPGKSYDDDGFPPSQLGGPNSTERRTVGQSKTYEEIEVEDKAQENLEELADAQNASDDFKAKAKVIFETALNQKLQMEVERLEEEFSARFEKEITDIAEKVEEFLNYTSQQWLDENKLVVENGIRNELSESFMQGMKSLFEDHYVTLPDEKYDIFESMVAKLDDMENKLNEQIEANVALSAQMSGYSRDSILADVSWDLSQAAKDKLAGLAESVEFESEENYRQKLNILKESFLNEQVAEKPASSQYLEESAEPVQPSVYDGMNSTMARYARALSRTI
jgi:hypothetical protein